MTILNRLEPIISQSEASVNVGGLWTTLDRQIQISDFLTIGKISVFSYLRYFCIYLYVHICIYVYIYTPVKLFGFVCLSG